MVAIHGILHAMFSLLSTALFLATNSLTLANVETLHRSIQPPKNALWRSVPWEVSLLQAQTKAAEQKKPLFIWAMDGHPLGCT